MEKSIIKIGFTLFALLLLTQTTMPSVSAQSWDFPRLDEIVFKIKFPYTVSLEAAKACQIDTYVGAMRTSEVETLVSPPYNWTVTASPGFQMCYLGINCRDVTPETSGGRLDYHGRTPGFELYPLNLTAFRYALELIIGCNKTIWCSDIYGYINTRLDTVVPPANVKWYDPNIMPYPLDWTKAYDELIAAGFSGTIGGDDWIMPNGQPLRKPIYILDPIGAMENEIVRRHIKAWNEFFCGQAVCDPPHNCTFVNDIVPFYDIIDIAFYNRDHDIYILCWGLGRNPDYLWNFFHPDADIPDGSNSPGLSYRPLNALLDSLKWCRYSDNVDFRVFGPGPMTVLESTKYFTDSPFVVGSEDVWVGVSSGAGTYPYRFADLQTDVDYEVIASGGKGVGIRFLRDISLGAGMYIHMVYQLENAVTINSESELINLRYTIQEMLYYMCPYLPIYSRVYFDLYKPGLECWVPSLGYGSAAYQLKWTYGSIHWTGTSVGGTIGWHLPGPISTLHPWLKTSSYEETILDRVYEGMLEINGYTHDDIPWCGLKYKIEDWIGPSGEPGMKITWWIRDELTWQDGDPITVDDFIWDYEFINSTQPSQLHDIWAYYHGCVKYNDYCFSIFVNTTGIWAFYAYTHGPTYPSKVWLPYFGNKAAAEAFTPWMVPHPNGTLPTSLYGTGEWILDYYNSTTGTVRMYKNLNWWGRNAASSSRQIPGIHAPTNASRLDSPKVTKTSVGLYIFNLDPKDYCAHSWAFMIDGTVVKNGSRTLNPLGSASWFDSIPKNYTAGLHTFKLNVTTAYGSSVYSASMYVLLGDVDDNGIVNMLDIYMTASNYGKIGPACFSPCDVDNDGIIAMLDLYVCAINYGKTC